MRMSRRIMTLRPRGEPRLVYEGVAPYPLTTARSNLAAATAGDYAIFGGGTSSSSTIVSTVNAFDSSLTRTVPTGMGATAYNYAAASANQERVVFAGGSTNTTNNTYATNSVTFYTSTLGRGTTTLTYTTQNAAGVSAGTYALIAGGHQNSGTNVYHATVNAFTPLGTRSTPTALSLGRQSAQAASVDGVAFIAGGYGSSGVVGNVDRYDASLTRTTVTALSTVKMNGAATNIGDYVLIGGGGVTTSSTSNVVNAYTAAGTRTIATALSTARYHLRATTIGDFAIFAGGNAAGNGTVVDVYDAALTRTVHPNPLSVARTSAAGVSVGNYALFGGGNTGSTYHNSIDVYTIR